MSRHQSQNTRLTLSTSPASHFQTSKGGLRTRMAPCGVPARSAFQRNPCSCLQVIASGIGLSYTGSLRTGAPPHKGFIKPVQLSYDSILQLSSWTPHLKRSLQLFRSSCVVTTSAHVSALATLMTRTHSYLVRKCCTRPVPRRKRIIFEEFASTCNTIWTDFPNISFWNSQRPMASDQLFAGKFKAVSLREVASLKPFSLSSESALLQQPHCLVPIRPSSR